MTVRGNAREPRARRQRLKPSFEGSVPVLLDLRRPGAYPKPEWLTQTWCVARAQTLAMKT